VYCQDLTYTEKAYLLNYFWQFDLFAYGPSVTEKTTFFKDRIVTAIYGIDKMHIEVLKDELFNAYNEVQRRGISEDSYRNPISKFSKGFVQVLYECMSALTIVETTNYISDISKREQAYEQRYSTKTESQIGMQMFGVYKIYAVQKLSYELFTIYIQDYFLKRNDKPNQSKFILKFSKNLGEFLFFLGSIADTSILALNVNRNAVKMHERTEVYLDAKLFFENRYEGKNPIAELIAIDLTEMSEKGVEYVISDEVIEYENNIYIAPRRGVTQGETRGLDDLDNAFHSYVPLSLAASELHTEPAIATDEGLIYRNHLPLNNVIWCKSAYDKAGIPNQLNEEQLKAAGSLDAIMEQIAVMPPSCSFGLEFEGVRNDIKSLPNPLYVEGSRDPEKSNAYISAFQQLADMFVERGIPAKEAGHFDSNYTLLQVKPDVSVYVPSGGTNFEMVLAPYIGQAALDNCQKTLEAMLDMGCRVHQSAGYHIHVQVIGTSSSDDPNNELNVEQRKNLIWNFACMEPWLFETMTPQHRRRSAERWAQPLTALLKQRMGRFNQANTPLEIRNALDVGPMSRYYALNIVAELTKPTYEFRFPHSNFEYQSANNLMLVIDKLYQFSKVARFPPKGDLKLEKLLGTPLWTYWMNIGIEYADPDTLERSEYKNDIVYDRLKKLRNEF
jgi:hypothetical protein